MFNDERINKELSNLKKYLIIISIIVCIFFLGVKLLYLTKYDLSLVYYITEIVIIIMGTGILIGGCTIKSEIKDEAFYDKINQYYNKAFKIFVFLSFLSFSFVMGGTILSNNQIFSSANTINLVLPITLFVGYAYIRFKNIYFNYNIIEENNKIYYKGVFKNILKIFLFFLIIYVVGFLSTIIFMSDKSLGFTQNDLIFAIGSIVIAFFVSSLSISIYYFIISLFERLFVKEEDSKKITIPTIILIIMGLLFNIICLIISIRINIITDRHSIDSNSVVNFAEIITNLSNTGNFFREWGIHLEILGLVFFIYDITKNNKGLKNKFNIPLLIFIFYNIFTLIMNKVDPMFLQFINNLQVSEISEILYIKQIVIYSINIAILFALLIMIIKKFKNEVLKYKWLFVLIIIKCVLVISNFILSLTNNLTIAYSLQIAWLITLLILFIIYSIKKFNKKINESDYEID